MPVQVRLAGTRAAFRTSSVADKGHAWELKYDTQLDLPSVTVAEVPLADGEEASYRAVTRSISSTAEAQLEDEEELVVLAVRTPRARDDTDHTEELLAYHEARSRLVLEVDPARPREASEPAFVAMPFGLKPYPERGWKQFEADLSYTRIMTPTLIDAGYRPVRADTDALLEAIDHAMLRHLNRSKLVNAGLAMLNPNVMWEIGLRHAWRRSGTVLIGPKWVTSPFDVKRIPLHQYERTARRISDAHAVAAIKRLREVLADVGLKRVDSPVFANVGPEMEDIVLPALDEAAEAEAGRLLEGISHEQLLGGTPPETPSELYARAAPLTDQQRKSAGRQLALLRDAGDPAAIIDPLLGGSRPLDEPVEVPRRDALGQRLADGPQLGDVVRRVHSWICFASILPRP